MNHSQKKRSDLDRKDYISYVQNPLQTLFYAAIIIAIFSLYRLFTGGGILAGKDGFLTAYSQQIMKLLFTSCFILCYQKQSILTWWIALLSGPILWVTYFIFQPFKITQIVIPLFIYAIVISYLAVKYRLYRDYITSKKDADARAAQ
jgi:hypothetical protein